MNDSKVFVPPLKIQGIKTKLVPLIKSTVILHKDSLWIEPFMGSGVVGFNIAPSRAIFSDTNPHIINFYKQIQNGKITPYIVRCFLEEEGKKLSKLDGEYYYEVRKRFNQYHNPLDFLFLNRSCFNGMMRFNKNNEFNVPYGHKPLRFSKAYITKIVNQVAYVESKIKENDWEFLCQSFEDTILCGDENSFIYCDPPYIDRNVDYFDSWDENLELKLCECLKNSEAKFMLSTWDRNIYRQNDYVERVWNFCYKTTREHFYYVGAKTANRNSVIEALLTNYIPASYNNELIKSDNQMSLFNLIDVFA